VTTNSTTQHSRARLAAALLGVAAMGSFAVGAVGAVGVSGAGATTKTVDSHKKAPKKTKKKKAAATGCSSFTPGKKGVTQTFCGGKAVIMITAGASTVTIKGGTCAVSGPYFTVNAGVVVGPGFKGAKPNYFGVDANPAPGAFTNATISYTLNGTGGLLTKNSGTTDHKTGTFSGTDLTGAAVTGSFTC
jgi:hypothetical protein